MSEPSRLVMVVDGDPAVRREVRTACEQDGYQVLDAETGADALRLHTSAHPILALLEVSLPDGSGYDVCRELRRTDPTTPVIMMSSRSDEIDRKSTRLNSSHTVISYAVFCLKKKKYEI